MTYEAACVFGIARPGPVLSFLPIILLGILFGLAMDYEVPRVPDA